MLFECRLKAAKLTTKFMNMQTTVSTLGASHADELLTSQMPTAMHCLKLAFSVRRRLSFMHARHSCVSLALNTHATIGPQGDSSEDEGIGLNS